MRFALLFALVLPVVASGQTVWPPAQLAPPSPTEIDVIRATFTKPGTCDATSISTVVIGTVIRTTVAGPCVTIDPPLYPGTASADFGPLPAGTYTYEIYFAFDDPPTLRSTQTIVVAAFVPPVPMMSGLSMMLLALGVSIAAVVAIGPRIS